MSSIFNISERLVQAYELALSGEVDDETIATTIECIEWELQKKADNYLNFITEVKGNNDVIDNEIERLKALKQSNLNFINALKRNLHHSMVKTDNKKFKTPLHSYWIQLNPPSLIVSDESKIPKSYYIPQPDKLDNVSLKKDLLNGRTVEGAEITQEEGVRFR